MASVTYRQEETSEHFLDIRKAKETQHSQALDGTMLYSHREETATSGPVVSISLQWPAGSSQQPV